VTLYPSGDVDYYRINANETDGGCGCCDFFCTDEDYRLSVTLTVPADAGSYQFCMTGNTTSCANDPHLHLRDRGSSQTLQVTLDGACPGTDSYSVFVRISGGSAPGFECSPYTLSYGLVPGCF
jgi:hypothetical protein